MSVTKQLPIVLVLFFTCLCSAAEVKDDELSAYKVILLHYSGAIAQPWTTVKPGTTVIWVNNSNETLQICFEGQQVSLACKSPVHFIRGENGSFTSRQIPQGAVASLCFVEKGEYKYVARKIASGSEKSYLGVQYFKGKIIVK